MGTISQSVAGTATAYANQRKIDRAQNGVLWAMHYTGTVGSTGWYYVPSYSTDNGATWINSANAVQGSATNVVGNHSFFIDVDDYAHLVYKHPDNGFIYHTRGTPNAARTAYTWSAAVAIDNTSTVNDYPDIVAFRDPATAGAWVAWVVYGYNNNNQNKMFARRVNIAANGNITVSGVEATSAQLAAANANSGYPSIDFNHTGDGKTVAGGTPHLYVGWSAGATGAGYGIRFRKATYASGSWTWGTEREIDSTRLYGGNHTFSTLFDGQRVVIAGSYDNGLFVHDRDAADTTTTTRTVDPAGAPDSAGIINITSWTYDASGNVYFASQNGGLLVLAIRKWTRATGVLGPETRESSTNVATGHPSFRRGSQGSAIDYVYTDGNQSPYTVRSGRISVNQAPNAPTLTAPADGATVNREALVVLQGTFSDPDAGDTISAFEFRYRIFGTTAWTLTPAGGAYNTVTGVFDRSIPANSLAGTIEWQARVADAAGAWGPWSASRTFIAGPPAGGAGALGRGLDPIALLAMTRADKAQQTADAAAAAASVVGTLTAATFGIQKARGTWVGDNSDPKAIAVGFAPDLVIVHTDTTSSTGGGYHILTQPISAALQSRLVGGDARQGGYLTATGFSITGNFSAFNSNGVQYFWAAFRFGA